MRKLKFRAWDGNTMYNPYYICGQTGKVVYPACNDSPDDYSPDPIMQYTGLSDKNGKEIYEGDIIMFDNSQIGGKEIIGEVMFNMDNTLSNLEWGLFNKNGYHSIDFLGDNKVIGNIYENPDLMKG
jgi:uncharacterized phage protein (TIGR01671 family)